MRFSRSTAVALAALAALAATPTSAREGSAADATSVSGQLEVLGAGGSRRIRLKYGYATYEPMAHGNETVSKAGVTVYLSEDPLPADRRERETFVAVRSKEGRFRGVRLTVIGGVGIGRAYCDGCVWKSPDLAPFWTAWFMGDYSFVLPTEKQTPLRVAIDRTGDAVTANIQSELEPEADGIEGIRVEAIFTIPIDDTLDSYAMSPIDPAIARAYETFRTAVDSGKLSSARALVAAEYAASLYGPGAKRHLAVLRSILERFGRVERSTAVGTSVVAEAASASPPGTPKQRQPPVLPDHHEIRLSERVSAEFLENWRSPVPDTLSVRFIREAGAWKVYWVLDRFGSNVLAAGYRTPGEHVDAIRERRRPEDEQYFAVEGGERLPMYGGAVGATYLEFTRAESAADKDAFARYLLADQRSYFARRTRPLEPGFAIWKWSGITGVRVVGGEANAREATLRVTGTSNGVRVTGRVRMVREDDVWKVARELWDRGADR